MPCLLIVVDDLHSGYGDMLFCLKLAKLIRDEHSEFDDIHLITSDLGKSKLVSGETSPDMDIQGPRPDKAK